MADSIAKIVLEGENRSRQAFREVESSLRSLDQNASGLRDSLRGLAAGLGVAAFGAWVKSSVDAADALDELSEKTGLTVERLSELQYVAKLSGASSEDLNKGLRALANTMAQGGDAFVNFSRATGVTVDVTKGLDSVITQLATGFAKLPDGYVKTALATDLLKRTGADLAPLLSQGAEGIARLSDEARRLGVVVSTDTARQAAKLNDDLDRLNASATGLGNAIAASTVPAMAQLVTRMADATREGGLLRGILTGLAEAGKIAIFGVDPTEVQKQRQFVQEIKGEILDLERTMQGRGKLGGGYLERFIYGDPAEQQRKLAELKRTLADAQRALAGLENPPKPAAKSAAADPFEAARREAEAQRKREEAQRAAREAAREAQQAEERDYQQRLAINKALSDQEIRQLEAQSDAQARIVEERQAELINRLQEGPEIAARAQAEAQARVSTLIAGTKSGRRNEAYEDLRLLNSAFDQGKISASELDEAYGSLRDRLKEIDGGAKGASEAIKPFATDVQSQLRQIEGAVRNFGNRFTDSIIETFKKGRLEAGKILEAIAEDIARLTIQQGITAPLFNAIAPTIGQFSSSLFGGGGAGAGRLPPTNTPPAYVQTFGPGKASGGPVMPGVAYPIGERGAEWFVPATRGTVVPFGAELGGGMRVTQVFNIAPGTDAGTVYRAASLGAAMARSSIARDAQIGAMG